MLQLGTPIWSMISGPSARKTQTSELTRGLGARITWRSIFTLMSGSGADDGSVYTWPLHVAGLPHSMAASGQSNLLHDCCGL